ncbi:MAG: LOG family protein [Phycisphaerales bacterium]
MTTPHDMEIVEGIDALMTQVGGDPDSFAGQLVREMMTSCLKLVTDGADTGELKLITRSIKELRYALKVFRPYRGTRKISMFGSARTPEDDPTYHAAVEFARHLSRAGWMVITGAGDGIMKAGHGGAGREGSFGVSIRLPFETTANEIIAGDSKLVTFRYFFTRKLLFVSQADAVALFAGGFGTHDEGFEVLTLIQTGKSPLVPLVMVDAPGDDYWKQWDAYVRKHLLARRMIGEEDLNLYHVTDDPRKAAEHVLKFYSNYHSQRFVKDKLVIRMNHRLSDEKMNQLNADFADLIESGRGGIEQVGPHKLEEDFPDLPRLGFAFNRRNHGRLRRLIDAINE